MGKFDYLKEYCEVVYLERTKGVSSTEIRNVKNRILKLGIVGNGRIARRFIKEARFVSGIDVEYVFGRNAEKLQEFCKELSLSEYFLDYDKFLENVDAVYIALPHTLHYQFTKEALLKGKHVLCEKPITLSQKETDELFALAYENNLILQEAIKTVYAPCFSRLLATVKSGIIGNVKDIEATFTKLENNRTLREYDYSLGGGSLTELGSYPLCLITKILGVSPQKVSFIDFKDSKSNVDLFNKIILKYPSAIATASVGLGVKKDGSCTISGTKGYIYIPAPWWKIEYFEVHFENINQTRKIFIEFQEDGLRYELATFLKAIHSGKESYKLTAKESSFISSLLEAYRNDREYPFIKEIITLK